MCLCTLYSTVPACRRSLNTGVPEKVVNQKVIFGWSLEMSLKELVRHPGLIIFE